MSDDTDFSSPFRRMAPAEALQRVRGKGRFEVSLPCPRCSHLGEQNLVPFGTILPTAESHVRELLKLEQDDQRAEVWRRIVSRGETITLQLHDDLMSRRHRKENVKAVE